MDTEIRQKYPFLRKYGWIIAAGVIFTGLIIAGISSIGHTSYTTDGRGMIISDVTEGEFNDFIRVRGKVEAATIVQISALETGIVEKKHVEEGAFVNPGDLILTLHNPLLRQQILDSESQLAERQNMLRDTELAMEKERLQIKQDLLTARTDLNRKQRNAEQQKALFDEQLTSREEYLKAQEDYRLALENVQLLQNRQHQDSIYRNIQIAMMKESLQNMQENFALVRQRADNLNVKATHKGQIGSLDAEIGQNISGGQQIGQINILDNYKLSVLIDEHYIDRVSPGLHGMANRQNQALATTIRKVYPEVSNGQFRADLVFDDNTDNLRVGQTYPVEIQLGESENAVMLPRGSFFQTSGGKWVYVLDKDGKSATKRQIQVGRQNPQYYEIIEGLVPGEKVITSSYSNFGEAESIIFND